MFLRSALPETIRYVSQYKITNALILDTYHDTYPALYRSGRQNTQVKSNKLTCYHKKALKPNSYFTILFHKKFNLYACVNKHQ